MCFSLDSQSRLKMICMPSSNFFAPPRDGWRIYFDSTLTIARAFSAFLPIAITVSGSISFLISRRTGIFTQLLRFSRSYWIKRFPNVVRMKGNTIPNEKLYAFMIVGKHNFPESSYAWCWVGLFIVARLSAYELEFAIDKLSFACKRHPEKRHPQGPGASPTTRNFGRVLKLLM